VSGLGPLAPRPAGQREQSATVGLFDQLAPVVVRDHQKKVRVQHVSYSLILTDPVDRCWI